MRFVLRIVRGRADFVAARAFGLPVRFRMKKKRDGKDYDDENVYSNFPRPLCLGIPYTCVCSVSRKTRKRLHKSLHSAANEIVRIFDSFSEDEHERQILQCSPNVRWYQVLVHLYKSWPFVLHTHLYTLLAWVHERTKLIKSWGSI